MQRWIKVIISLLLMITCITLLALRTFDNPSLIVCLTSITFTHFMNAILPSQKVYREIISCIVLICVLGILYSLDQTILKDLFINVVLFIFIYYGFLKLILIPQMNDTNSLTYGDDEQLLKAHYEQKKEEFYRWLYNKLRR
ncbi:hypothetical protein KC460_03345 [Candidatus Dependentiae bacterium]|nr:hypothetical protein [Candidatus Dependentiae bacterium]